MNAFSPQGQRVGEQIGAKALTERNCPGFFSAIVSAPCPPIEWPLIACRSASTGNFAFTSAGSSRLT